LKLLSLTEAIAVVSRYNRRVSYNIATFDENKIGKVSLNLFRVIARGLITGSRVVALTG
jgi:hypothetical protein